MIARSILCAATLLGATPALASVVFRGDFETGDFSQWSSVEAGNASHMSVVSDPVGQGRYAMKITLADGDFIYNGTRNEVDDEHHDPKEGDERYYHWRTLFPSDFQTVSSWEVFTQWHQYVTGGSPPVEFDVANDTLSLVTNRPNNSGETTHWRTPLVRGVWHDFVFHVRWSSDPSVGFIELTYDGEQVLPRTSVATMYSGDTVYLKQGLYRDSNQSLTQTAYHDGMVVGTTLADVTDTSGTPTDPGTDGGTTPGGVGVDAGTPGSGSDAGTGSGSGQDGSGTDAGTSGGGDGSGTPDNGGGGSTTTDDGGTPLTSGGSVALPSKVAGGCTALPIGGARSAWLWLAGPLAFAALFLRRRRRTER